MIKWKYETEKLIISNISYSFYSYYLSNNLPQTPHDFWQKRRIKWFLLQLKADAYVVQFFEISIHAIYNDKQRYSVFILIFWSGFNNEKWTSSGLLKLLVPVAMLSIEATVKIYFIFSMSSLQLSTLGKKV